MKGFIYRPAGRKTWMAKWLTSDGQPHVASTKTTDPDEARAFLRAQETGTDQGLPASLVLAVLYYWIPSLIIGRGVFVIASVVVVALVAGWRLAFE